MLTSCAHLFHEKVAPVRGKKDSAFLHNLRNASFSVYTLYMYHQLEAPVREWTCFAELSFQIHVLERQEKLSLTAIHAVYTRILILPLKMAAPPNLLLKGKQLKMYSVCACNSSIEFDYMYM